jgi:hypothetical protein
MQTHIIVPLSVALIDLLLAKYISITGNDFFLRATGLSEREAKRLTIFSIVQPSELSDLYKMVARTLAEKSVTSTNATTFDTGAGDSSATNNTNEEGWQAITLKCIPFSSCTNTKTNNSIAPSTTTSLNNNNTASSVQYPQQQEQQHHSLSITVALMEDMNRDQRCFHCILTDCPGTDGKLGSVTPELFAKLFNPNGAKNKFEGVMAK